MTGASISIDAKIMWITHSMPISPLSVLKAKLHLALSITLLPSLMLSTACVILMPIGVLDAICVTVGTAAFVAFMALFGLCVNICLPKFDWASETVAIKQSASTLVTMFAPFVLIVPAVIIAYVTESYSLVMYAFTALIVILNILIYLWLYRKGAEKYSRLCGA